jgi:putative ABC transport system permease protein
MFLIDIQKDQQEAVGSLVERLAGERPMMVPTVRVRIAAVNGRQVDLEKIESRRERGRLGNEHVVTYRATLDQNEEIIDGKFWDAGPAEEPEVSIEDSMRGIGGIDLGGAITFDVQGRKLNAKVTSVRNVDRRNARRGFGFVFRPGVLDDAPQLVVAAVNGPVDEVERSRFQRAVLDEFSNLSIIDVTEILRGVKRIAENVTLAVTFIGGFVFLSGALILIGSIAMTKFQRIYEAAVLKTLGAKRKTLVRITLAEYGLIGVIAGLIGALSGQGLAYATSKYIFEIPWRYSPGLNGVAVGITVALVVIVGMLSTLDVLSRKPLSILRGQ